MWLDADTNLDYVNFGETADLIVSLLKDPAMLPVSIGIYGGWGSGKSTLLRLVERRLGIGQEDAPADVIAVNFDAWLYQDFDDARAALMESIATAVAKHVETNTTAMEKVGRVFKRINYMRALALGADLALTAATGGVLGGLASATVGMAQRAMRGAVTADDAAAVRGAAGTAAAAADGLLLPEESSTPPREIQAFRDEFREVLEVADKPLVVIIDNLDRCLPRSAIQTLEAIRLFLFMPRTAFIVAAVV